MTKPVHDLNIQLLLSACFSCGPWGWVRYLGCLTLVLGCTNGLLLSAVSAAESPDAQVAALLRQQVVRIGSPAASTADAAQVAHFYALTNYGPVWTRGAALVPDAWTGLNLLTTAEQVGLKATDYKVERLRSMLDSVQQGPAPSVALRVRTEQQLTAQVLRFARHLRSGRIGDTLLRPPLSERELAFDPALHVLQALRSGQFAAHLLAAQPTSRSYVRLRWAWQRLLHTDSAAARRLTLPVALNLERLRWEPQQDSLYMVVNIPAYSLQIVRGAQVVASHRVIVGKADTPTPELYSQLTYFQAAPEWRVPNSIAVGEMLPRLKQAPNYLARHGYKLYTAAGQPANPYRINWKQITPATFAYQVRQAPSSSNALGRVVFRFANSYAIYLHDTPAKAAFRADRRALSHGCVRVEKPLLLAQFLLQRDDAPQAARRIRELQASVSRNRTTVFSLRAPVPLYVRYLTCEADGNQLRQLPDIYQRDNALAQAWQADVSPLASVGQ
ncbi:L,D-transpeptidase family protein [Hymenobacter crusticola]|uniref:L,D-TPase catalytic domain-containing protein n=1 Tax=Hymenobacter crusticola TaxID=1770526 RepID=A0A243WEY3_9BACT|nr:L,D-transpeptidase family protein [Hymenobacter crusticola]OUJ74256.1 hypothetical protein BXP70_11075 [Hymenobacter crusticola]